MVDVKKGVKEKPLDKMTVKELREIAKEMPEITGVHGMNKEDLLSAVKKAKGIKEAPRKKGSDSTKELKAKIKVLKVKKAEAVKDQDKKKTAIFRRKISRLKKKTRQAARSRWIGSDMGSIGRCTDHRKCHERVLK
jgi:hypothetical protein